MNRTATHDAFDTLKGCKVGLIGLAHKTAREYPTGSYPIPAMVPVRVADAFTVVVEYARTHPQEVEEPASV
jgi:hypothetical protein